MKIESLPTAATIPSTEGLDTKHENFQDQSDAFHGLANREHPKQAGVKRMEGLEAAWSKKTLMVMFLLLYMVSFVDMLMLHTQGPLMPYVTSAFGSHSLLATTTILSTILSGVAELTLAKIIDIFGRLEGFTMMTLCWIIGVIMKAACQNVETYAAGQCFYFVGHFGVQYVINIMVADMTSLRNRMIVWGLQASPIIITAFAGPRIAELFYTHVNFRWAFGAFVIIFSFFGSLFIIAFYTIQRHAEKIAGSDPEKAETRTMWESGKYYVVQFDVIGLFLTTAGGSLLLLATNLAASAPHGWGTGYIIAMIVLGIASCAAVVLWERFFAPIPYLPFEILKDRTIWTASLLYGVAYASIFCWDTYYSSFVQVVFGLDITEAGYVQQSVAVLTAFAGPFVGFWIRYTGNFKYLALAGFPFFSMGTPLLLHFRHADSGIGYNVMCLVFIGIATGIWTITSQIAVMASISHQQVAVGIAIAQMFRAIGASLGMGIAGAIWTNSLPRSLSEHLPQESKHLAGRIFSSIRIQLSYPMGSPIRTAIIASYSEVQRKLVIASSAFLPFAIVSLLLWRNIDIREAEARTRP